MESWQIAYRRILKFSLQDLRPTNGGAAQHSCFMFKEKVTIKKIEVVLEFPVDCKPFFCLEEDTSIDTR